MAAELEVIVDRSMGGEKLLGVVDCLKPPHVALAPLGGLMRHLTASVEIPALPMLNTGRDLAFRGSIGSEFIRHDHPGSVAQAFSSLRKKRFAAFVLRRLWTRTSSTFPC